MNISYQIAPALSQCKNAGSCRSSKAAKCTLKFSRTEIFHLNYAHNERPERWSRPADAVRG